MIGNSNQSGNVIFHIALNSDGTLQPIINVRLLWSNYQMLKDLLHTDNIGSETAEGESAKYLFLFDGDSSRPYPSVMIWKYIQQNDDLFFADMEQGDYRAVKYAAERYLI